MIIWRQYLTDKAEHIQLYKINTKLYTLKPQK